MLKRSLKLFFYSEMARALYRSKIASPEEKYVIDHKIEKSLKRLNMTRNQVIDEIKVELGYDPFIGFDLSQMRINYEDVLRK